MQKLYGVWIDHSHAYIIVANPNKVETLIKIESNVGPHHHSGVAYEHLTITNQKKDDERRHHHMNHFLKEILGKIGDANEILIFGPSNAKYDLKHAIEKTKSMKKALLKMETADIMTENQLKAFVKEAFQLPR